MKHTKGEQKKCDKHGYYWVGLCCDGQIADDICPDCLKNAAPDLLVACKRMLGAMSCDELNNGRVFDDDLRKEVKIEAKAAVAKAEGK